MVNNNNNAVDTATAATAAASDDDDNVDNKDDNDYDKLNSKDETLLKIYTDPSNPASYGSIDKLYKASKIINNKINKNDVKKFLANNRAYTLHRQSKKNFIRRRIFSKHPKHIASTDLADMSLLSRYNNGVKYLLVIIDIFSRFLSVYPLKRKDGQSVLVGIKHILETDQFRGIKFLNSDEGGEYYNKYVKDYLQKKNIKLYSTFSREIKASIAERVIRTIKSKIFKYLTHKNTKKYVDVLNQIVSSYNNSAHRGLKRSQTPNNVHKLTDPNLIQEQFDRMYKDVHRIKKNNTSLLTLGQAVRIVNSDKNKVFRKGYLIQNTEEIFKIKSIDNNYIPTVYYLEDLEGEEIKGKFYRDELIPCEVPQYFHIDIIKQRTINKKKQYFVHWRGYPESSRRWVDAVDIKTI